MKKYKKKIFNSLSMFCILGIILMITLIINKSNISRNTYMVIGQKLYVKEHMKYMLDSVDNKKITKGDDTFVFNNCSSSNLLKMLQENIKKSSNQKMIAISDVINLSNYITIFLGNNDLTDKIKYTNQELKYDLDILNRQIEITSLNTYHIIDEIKLKNDEAKIMLVGFYLPYYNASFNKLTELEKVFNNLNDSLKEVCLLSNASFVDISLLENKKYYQENSYEFNQNGIDYLNKKIVSCALENKC